MRTKVDYRQIYIDNYGEIPRGYDIHHKDGNSHNNHPSNLEALHPVEHAKKHLEMGEKTVAALILGRYRKQKRLWKIYKKAFGSQTGITMDRRWNVDGPVVQTKETCRSWRNNMNILKKTRGVKPDEWGWKRYRDVLFEDYSKDFDNPDYSFISDAMHLLSDRQSDIIKRNFNFLGPKQTIDSIADELGVNEKTIRRDIRKALEIIKKEISFKFS